jgi:hypothetical protein
MLFNKSREKYQPLTKCGLFLVKTVLKYQLCHPFVIQEVVLLGIFLVKLPFISHPAVYQLSGISLSGFDAVVPCLNFQKHLEFGFPYVVVQYLFLAVDALAEIKVTVLRDLLKIGCSFETF